MTLFASKTIEECLFRDEVTVPGGIDYLEFHCMYPGSEKFYMAWEKNMDYIIPTMFPYRQFMIDHPVVPFIAVALYGLAIYYGQKYFEARERWNLRYTLAVWNFSLSAFSTLGAIRLIPHILHHYLDRPLRVNLCEDIEVNYGRGNSGMWILFFVLSKFPELFDTFFIIVHKKPLIVLHWYHHITVLLYCWSSYVNKVPAGPLFAAMNFSVHAVMYGYYFLMAMRMKPKWMKPVVITIAQILQMVVGVLVTIAQLYYYFNDPEKTCQYSDAILWSAFLMYFSYLLLFLHFFFGRYAIIPSKVKNV